MGPIRFDFCFYYNLNLKLSPKQSLLYILQRLCGEVRESRRLGIVPCLYHQLTP